MKAVILAGGLGRRFQATSGAVPLNGKQLAVASTGIKSLMPVAADKTLLDLSIERLVGAGFLDICLVVGPHNQAIGNHCETRGHNVSFAIQAEPKGTADAVLAAQSFTKEVDFLVVNSDNLYPQAALTQLRECRGPALVAFTRLGLVARGNIVPQKIGAFAAVEADARGCLRRIVEKPDALDDTSLISMNCWRFSAQIYQACLAISVSQRGELELPTAVQFAIDHLGAQFQTFRSEDGVLDLTTCWDAIGFASKLEAFL